MADLILFDFSENMFPNKDIGFHNKVPPNILDEPDHSFERQHQNQASDKECEDSDKETDEPCEGKRDIELDLQNQISEISVARSDVATVGSNESDSNQQEFQEDEDVSAAIIYDDKSSTSSSSSLMDSALPQYKQTVENVLEDSHERIDSQIDTTYNGLINDIETRKENVYNSENESIKSENGTEPQSEKIYSKSETIKEIEKDTDDEDIKGRQEDIDNNTGNGRIINENFQQIVQSRGNTKEIIVDKVYINNVDNIIHNLSTAFKSLEQKCGETNETMQENIDHQGEQVEDVRNKMEFLSNLTHDINKMTLEMQTNVKDLQGLTVKVPNVENLFRSIQEKVRMNEDGIKAKFDEQNGRFNGEIRDVLSKYYELERKLNLIDELTKKSKESEKMIPKIEDLNRTNQELDVKIWKIQEKSEELELNTNELEVSLRNKLEELERKINALKNDVGEDVNKSDSLMIILEKTKSELEICFQKEIKENEKDILKRLDEDRTKKLALMIATVTEEAEKVYKKLEIVDSNYETLQKEFKESDAEIMKRIEEDSVTSDQIIRDKIREAIDLYTTEYDEKVTLRIREAIESYEERVNKLADASFELEASFNEEIQKAAERRIHAIEEENRKLKEHKRELKNRLEAKEAEYFECKLDSDRNDEIITGLGRDKVELEDKVHYLKNDRKQLETKVKEMEDKLNERERIYRVKLAETDEEIRTMKFDNERLDQAKAVWIWYKRWFNISIAIIAALLIAIFYLLVNPFENNWNFINLGPAPQ